MSAEKSLKVTIEIHAELTASKDAEGLTVNQVLAKLIAAYKSPTLPTGIPSEVEDDVNRAIAQGADLEKLLADGLRQAAKRYIDQTDRRASIDFASMSDGEIESIDIKQAKALSGLAQEKIRRTIARLESWNEAHPQQPIDITASFVIDLRDELKRLTAGRITGISRNAVFDHFKSLDQESTLPRGHNAAINAKALAVQAFRDLIEDKIEPIYQSVFESHLAS